MIMPQTIIQKCGKFCGNFTELFSVDKRKKLSKKRVLKMQKLPGLDFLRTLRVLRRSGYGGLTQCLYPASRDPAFLFIRF
jgi:hypothetical protein